MTTQRAPKRATSERAHLGAAYEAYATAASRHGAVLDGWRRLRARYNDKAPSVVKARTLLIAEARTLLIAEAIDLHNAKRALHEARLDLRRSETRRRVA